MTTSPRARARARARAGAATRQPPEFRCRRPSRLRRRGATMVEYSLMLALIAVVLMAAVSAFAQNLKTVYGTVNTFIVNAVSSSNPAPPPPPAP